MKILTIVGTRPQILKIVPGLKGQDICWTGQHYDDLMKDVFFKELGIKPDYDFDVSRNVKKRGYGMNLGEMIDDIIAVLHNIKYDYVLVIGDCRSTIAGAIAAHQTNIKLIHLEAGCRSGDLTMIEERNRILVDRLSDILLVPSDTCMDNLISEGQGYKQIFKVGTSQLSNILRVLPTKRIHKEQYDLLTIHRDFNTNKETLNKILGALKSDKEIIFPVHPRTKLYLDKIPKNIKVIEPVGYSEMINLMAYADRVITDSGGVQVEAYALSRPIITLRENTEWPETVKEGWNILVGSDPTKIKEAFKTFYPMKRHNSDAYSVNNKCDSHKIIKSILENL